jgi:hypothetical protein
MRPEGLSEWKNLKHPTGNRIRDLTECLKVHHRIPQLYIVKGKGKGFPATGLSRLFGIRKVKTPDFLDYRHYEGGKVVTLTHRPSLPPRVSWYSFLEAESTPGHMVPPVATEKIPSDTTGDRSRDLPTSKRSSLTTTLPQTQLYIVLFINVILLARR